MATQHDTAITVRGLTKNFTGRQILDDLDLDFHPGEFVALLGRSGSGKSTLLRILAGLDRDIDGEVTVPDAVSVAFQEPRLLPWRTVGANVRLALDGADRHEIARRSLHEVGLAEHETAWPLTLSGGEAQRVSLARALVRQPRLLLLDEPFGALDALTRISMRDLVRRLCRIHRPTVLLVTHDVEEALALADRTLVLGDGRIVAEHSRPLDESDLAAVRARVLNDLGVESHAG